jgi:hypothetical protein
MVFALICLAGWILWWICEDDLTHYTDKNGIRRKLAEYGGKCGGASEHMVESHTGIHRRRE